MEIAEVSIYVSSIVLLIIYILIVKRNSYRKGFDDGVKYYSNAVNGLVQHINQWNKKAKDAGMDLAAYVESIRPLNKAERSGEDETDS